MSFGMQCVFITSRGALSINISKEAIQKRNRESGDCEKVSQETGSQIRPIRWVGFQDKLLKRIWVPGNCHGWQYFSDTEFLEFIQLLFLPSFLLPPLENRFTSKTAVSP